MSVQLHFSVGDLLLEFCLARPGLAQFGTQLGQLFAGLLFGLFNLGELALGAAALPALTLQLIAERLDTRLDRAQLSRGIRAGLRRYNRRGHQQHRHENKRQSPFHSGASLGH